MRSGREHLAWMVVVEVRRRRKAAEGGRRRRKSTDIKSNNPHLAGGEKHNCSQLLIPCLHDLACTSSCLRCMSFSAARSAYGVSFCLTPSTPLPLLRLSSEVPGEAAEQLQVLGPFGISWCSNKVRLGLQLGTRLLLFQSLAIHG